MILVTGATGMLGAHLVLELLSRGQSVKALYRTEASKQKLLHIFSFYTIEPQMLFEQIHWVKGDVLDMDSLDEAVTDVNTVYHTAASVSFNPKKSIQLLKNNRKGTENIVNICLHHNLDLCHVSSIAALGSETNQNPITELSEWKPSEKRSAYALSKFRSELEVWRGITEGLNALIVNPSVILGPGNWLQGSSAIIKMAAKGMNYYTSGVTGFVDVRDVARLMVELTNSCQFGQRFIVSAQNLSYKQLFEKLNAAFGKPAPHKELTRQKLKLLWLLDKIRTFFTQKEPQLSNTFIDSLLAKNYFSDKKLQQTLHTNYTDLDISLQFFADLYILDHKS